MFIKTFLFSLPALCWVGSVCSSSNVGDIPCTAAAHLLLPFLLNCCERIHKQPVFICQHLQCGLCALKCSPRLDALVMLQV